MSVSSTEATQRRQQKSKDKLGAHVLALQGRKCDWGNKLIVFPSLSRFDF